MKIKHGILAAALAALALAPEARANETAYGYQGGCDTQLTWGTQKKDKYDVAILVQDPTLVGCKVTGLRVPLNVPGVTSASGWISTQLNLKKDGTVKVNDPDVCDVAGQLADGVLTVSFDQPYTLTDAGVFVGYTFNVPAITNESDNEPVAIWPTVNPRGFWVHTTRTHRDWQSRSESYGCVSAMEVMIEGDFVATDVAITTMPELTRMAVGKGGVVRALVTNHGNEPVSQIGYSYSFAGQQGSGVVDFDPPMQVDYNLEHLAKFAVPAIDDLGVYDGTIAVTTVNGLPNRADSPVATSIDVRAFVAAKRVLVEEYTGTWCGNCPRGTACMEHMSDEFPETFIGVAYHHLDAMDVMNVPDFPYPTNDYPMSQLDRTLTLDPVYRDVKPLWQQLMDVDVPIAVEVEAAWGDEDCETIGATITTTFPTDMDATGYKLAYILTADDLTGMASGWIQANYYAGSTDPMLAEWDPYMEQYVDLPSHIVGMKFQHVVVYAPYCKGLEGTVPARVTADTPYTWDIAIEADDVHSLQGENLIQDTDKLHLVAALIGPDGQVVNANKCHVTGSPSTGIGQTTAQGEDSPAVYYDLTGRRVANPGHGLYIRVQGPKASKVVL